MSQDEAEIFHDYRVLRRNDGSLWKLGAGAEGVTYKAIYTQIDAHVALKVISASQLDSDPVARDCFLREAKAAAGLRHRNVARVYRPGQNADSYFYAMEFFGGETIEDRVKRDGPMRVEAALALVLLTARALIAVHKAGFAHRDMKPSNLMLVNESDEDGVLKLIDFGLAKGAVPGAAAFTHAFSSPEQCQGLPVGIRSDIYSLGATLWFMLAGEPPWEKLDAFSVPASLRDLLGRMLAKDPDLRPQTPAALRVELEDCLRDCVRGVPVAEPEPVAAPMADPDGEETISDEPQPPLRQRRLFSRAWAAAPAPRAPAAITSLRGSPPEPVDAPSLGLLTKKLTKRRRPAVKRGPGMRIVVLALAALVSIAVLGWWADSPSLTTGPKPRTAPSVKPALNGDYEAGLNLWNGMGRALVDQPQAVVRFQAAAATGYAPAQAFLAVVYREGFGGVQRDDLQAEQWAKTSLKAGLRNEVQQGDPEAQLRLGLLYDKGIGVKKDVAKAVLLYKEAADQGNASAQYSLGLCCFNGSGVPRDPAQAASLYQKAADQGNAFAQNNLGFCYQIGAGVLQDMGKAVELYKKAAAQGNAVAQKNLGVCYFNGIGVEKDLAKAVELYQKAADRGNALAEFNLGVCYETGAGVVKDLNKAIEFYKKAADQGNAEAENNLGVCYEQGVGVEKDRDKAVEFYIKAADQGNRIAQGRLRSLLHETAK